MEDFYFTSITDRFGLCLVNLQKTFIPSLPPVAIGPLPLIHDFLGDFSGLDGFGHPFLRSCSKYLLVLRHIIPPPPASITGCARLAMGQVPLAFRVLINPGRLPRRGNTCRCQFPHRAYSLFCADVRRPFRGLDLVGDVLREIAIIHPAATAAMSSSFRHKRRIFQRPQARDIFFFG